MSTFNDVRTTRGRTHLCPRCGAEPNEGSVTIVLRQLGPSKQMRGGGAVASKTRSFCEPCAVTLYTELLGDLTTNGNGQPA